MAIACSTCSRVCKPFAAGAYSWCNPQIKRVSFSTPRFAPNLFIADTRRLSITATGDSGVGAGESHPAVAVHSAQHRHLLWERLLHVYHTAGDALIKTDTNDEVVEDGEGIKFVMRVAAALNKKPKASNAR